jgi:hypothetical protein
MEKELTPMQQLIAELKLHIHKVEDYNIHNNPLYVEYVNGVNEAIARIEKHLPKEQAAIEEAYKADLYPCSDEDATKYFTNKYK